MPSANEFAQLAFQDWVHGSLAVWVNGDITKFIVYKMQ